MIGIHFRMLSNCNKELHVHTNAGKTEVNTPGQSNKYFNRLHKELLLTITLTLLYFSQV